MSTQISPPTAPDSPAVDKSTKAGRGFRRFVAVLLALSVVLTAAYAAGSAGDHFTPASRTVIFGKRLQGNWGFLRFPCRTIPQRFSTRLARFLWHVQLTQTIAHLYCSSLAGSFASFSGRFRLF